MKPPTGGDKSAAYAISLIRGIEIKTEVSPMLAQYRRIKAEHSDDVLFFRLGDFYEMFAADALEVSALLNLTLTHRNGLPMCGLPYHSARTYIARLLKAGKKIAICEQLSAPQKGKSLIEREVVEVITPGTTVDEDFLEKGDPNYLACLCRSRGRLALAYIDLSTGDFRAASFPPENAGGRLRAELERLGLKELIVQESLLAENTEISRALLERGSLVLNRWTDWLFDSEKSAKRLKRQFGTENLKGFGLSGEASEIAAAGALLDYIDETAKARLKHITKITLDSEDDYVGIDEASQRNLELVRNMVSGDVKFSLLATMDETKTAMGRRLLKHRLTHPVRSLEKIKRRLAAVSFFYHNQARLAALRAILTRTPDLARQCSRLAMGKSHGKDLLSLRNALTRFSEIEEEMGRGSAAEPGRGQASARSAASSVSAPPHSEALRSSPLPPLIVKEEPLPRPLPAIIYEEAEAKNLDENAKKALTGLQKLLESGLVDDPSILLTEGKLIKRGYNSELDQLHELHGNGRSLLEAYLEEERQKTGISSLKIKYNRLIGYFFEVTNVHLEKVPRHFIKRQDLSGGERYTTDRLIALESEINGAQDRIIALEKDLFLELREKAANLVPEISAAAQCLAELDAAAALAEAATIHGWSEPEVNESRLLRIIDGRHPVIESLLPRGEFIPNDTILDAGRGIGDEELGKRKEERGMRNEELGMRNGERRISSEQGAMSREQRAESREQRVESREQGVISNEQLAMRNEEIGMVEDGYLDKGTSFNLAIDFDTQNTSPGAKQDEIARIHGEQKAFKHNSPSPIPHPPSPSPSPSLLPSPFSLLPPPSSIIHHPSSVSFALITGPNMAGKSTYLRQSALITIMAQTGSFVPAASAEIGIVDRIFCRVGAQDNLARGESTFLVEMNETAFILNTATDRSLVIMDEVGRGTGTLDGLAIARAVCDELLDRIRCRTLFATHYHELVNIANPRLANRSLEVDEIDGNIIFRRRLVEGPSADSYGLQVARLAGLPANVLTRAAEYYKELKAARTVAAVPDAALGALDALSADAPDAPDAAHPAENCSTKEPESTIAAADTPAAGGEAAARRRIKESQQDFGPGLFD